MMFFSGKRAAFFALFSAWVVMTSPVLAQSLYKWIDEDGNVTYQDSPPPNGSNFEEQVYSDSEDSTDSEGDFSDNGDDSDQQSLNEIADEHPVSFYSVERCDSCDLVRLFLENNDIPFVEKDIRTNVTLQQELQSRSGDLQVPTVIVGDKVVDGYSKSALRDALEEKGYPLGSKSNSSASEEDASDELSGSQLEELTNVFDEAEQQLEDAELEEESADDSVFEFESDEDPVAEIDSGS
jgi:glutaredoxin